tara:strand:+ start:1484 stop:2365 length:882 start_codon:yes stop_codon:yes gene_type:complete
LTKKKLFVWACDYSENSGEGKLARLFIQNINKKKKFNIKLNQKKILTQKYISTFWGIIYCWKKYINQETVCYLNYLPLWNFLIFIFLPPKTILGPITGGAFYSKSDLTSYFLRGLLFPIFYKISEFFLNIRKVKPIFSTNLLKKNLSNKTVKKSNFNFVVKNFLFKKNTKRKKKIDFIIYYRKHKNKESFFSFNLIKKIIQLKFKVYVVGDKLNLSYVKNCGYLSNKKISNLQSLARYTIVSGENPYSFFVLECLSHHIKVIIEKNMTKRITLFKKNFIVLNYNSLNSIKKLK